MVAGLVLAAGAGHCAARTDGSARPLRGAASPAPESPWHGTQLAARAFLIAGRPEDAEYRIYSYVLLGSPPDAANLSRDQAVLRAYLALDPAALLLDQKAEPADLNVVYLPLLDLPPPSPSASWLLAHYDYERARLLLGAAGGGNSQHPYLASYTSPLSPKPVIDENRLLLQDLSANPADLRSFLDLQLTPSTLAAETVRGDRRLTGREFLLAGKPEGPGYGLYSYLLFGEPLSPGNRDLYRAVLSAFLSLEEVRRFEAAGEARNQLNVTYLPLRERPPSAASLDWLLDHYDYARSQIILARLIDRPAGPYIVSYTSALSKGPAVESGRLLVEDLSGITADLAFLWVNEFTTQASRPQYWDKPALRTLMLNLRTQVAVAARAFVEVRSANNDLRSLFDSKIKIQE